MRIRIERYQTASRWWLLATYGLSVLAGFAAAAILLELSGANVTSAFSTLFNGAFGSTRAILRTLTAATPLILTGLASLVVFRARIWSIGQEGQAYAGAMGAYWAASTFKGFPVLVALPLSCLGGLLFGALLAWLAAVLRNRFAVNEIFSTVMLNYIVLYLLSYLLAGGPWTERGTTLAYHQTPLLDQSAWLPILATPLHLGFLLAVAAAALVHVFIERTPGGYDLRALGANETAMRFMGFNVSRIAALTMMLSGALAGLAGTVELLGLQHRLKADYLSGLGYDGIIVAMVGGLQPLGAVIVAILFGGLTSGAVDMRILSGVPDSLVEAMQGMILLSVLAGTALARYRITWSRPS